MTKIGANTSPLRKPLISQETQLLYALVTLRCYDRLTRAAVPLF